MTVSSGPAVAESKSLLERAHGYRFVLWWSVAWAVGIMALAPLVNFITPFESAGYANQWTPDVYWRLVMYWHGGIFIPWITVLAVLVAMAFKLGEMGGISGRLVRESIFVGGIFGVPIAGVAGIFNVYDHFALGAPLWIQIGAFLAADEIAIALVVAMINKPRTMGGFKGAGLPYYAIVTGVAGALFAALMGHVGGWITWFGPSPAPLSQYINSTMYPVLGFSNSTSVSVFADDVVGSHSHLMLVSLMAGVVGLVGTSYGFQDWTRAQKRIAGFGFAVMILALAGAIWVYFVSGVGNYAPPSFFVSGQNGVAGDDIATGVVGFGALFVLVALLMHAKNAVSLEGRPLMRDPLFVSLVTSWVLIYLVIPVTGFYINFNESFFQGTGLNFDGVFTRFHQDFGFFVLPSIVTLILAMNASGVVGRIRKSVGLLALGGELMAFFFGETYSLFTAPGSLPYVGQVKGPFPLGAVTLDLAIVGGALIVAGGTLAALQMRKGRAP